MLAEYIILREGFEVYYKFTFHITARSATEGFL